MYPWYSIHIHTHNTDTHNRIVVIIIVIIIVVVIVDVVLEMYSKLLDLMEEKQFYSALKTLEQLEHIYLPRVRGYIFSEALAKEIPTMRLSIENQSKAELKVYLLYSGVHLRVAGGGPWPPLEDILPLCIHPPLQFQAYTFAPPLPQHPKYSPTILIVIHVLVCIALTSIPPHSYSTILGFYTIL